MSENRFNYHFYYVSACCGSGKTSSAIEYISKEATFGEMFIIAQPTILLISKTLEAAREKYPAIDWSTITSDTHRCVATAIREAINSHRSKPTAIFITHAALSDLSSIVGKGAWNLIVDEVPQVDASISKKLPITFDWWTDLLVVSTNQGNHNLLDVRVAEGKLPEVRLYADNRDADDVISPVQRLFKCAISKHTDLFLNRAIYNKSLETGSGQLHSHTLMLPTTFAGWKDVTVMAANFENSLMFKIWSGMGVKFTLHPQVYVKNPAHSESTGRRLTIKYFTRKLFSKTLRDKVGLDKIVKALMPHVNGPHIWTANRDVADSTWEHPDGIRIKPVSHGLNQYCDIHAAIFLAALNDNPTHAKFLENTYALSKDEIGRAKYLEHVYQMIMRTSLRALDCTDPVTVIVPDRRAAEYLSELMPGATAEYIELGLPELRDDEPRRRKTVTKPKTTSKDRQSALREKRKAREAALDSLKDFASVDNPDFNPFIVMSDLYNSQTDLHVFADWDEMKDEFRKLAGTKRGSKEDVPLFRGSYFTPVAGSIKTFGKSNFQYSMMVTLDFDKSELPPKTFQAIMSDVKHVCFNSYSNGKDGFWHYRVIIPSSSPIDYQSYCLIYDMICMRLEDAGYATPKCKKAGLPRSGLDITCRIPITGMYMPSQAKLKRNSFFHENWEAEMFDPAQFCAGAPFELVAKDDAAEWTTGSSNAETTEWQQAEIDAAVADWHLTPDGEGNRKFYLLGVRLRFAGIGFDLIERILHQQHIRKLKSAPQRLSQIPRIMESLKRSFSPKMPETTVPSVTAWPIAEMVAPVKSAVAELA